MVVALARAALALTPLPALACPRAAGAPEATETEMSTAVFHALVDEYVRGYPTRGTMISADNIRYTAAKMLLLKSKDAAAASVEKWPDGAAVKLAACLFVLFVQEYLMHSQVEILGTRIGEIYMEIQKLLQSSEAITRETFAWAVSDVDTVGTASDLLQQPGIGDSLWGTGNLEELWSSAALGALQTVDEMTVYSGCDDQGTRSATSNELGEGDTLHRVQSTRESRSAGFDQACGGRATQAMAGGLRGRLRIGGLRSKRKDGVVVVSVDDPASFEGPQPRRRFLSRRFADSSLEALFRDYFFEVWQVWLKRAIITLSVFVALINVMYFSNPNFAMRSTGFLGDRLALGNTLATATMICALAWCALICAALTIPKLYSPRTYVIFLALSSFGIMLVFGLPVHLVDFRFRRQSMDDDLKAHMLYKHFNCSVDEMVQNQGRDAVIETALRAASHICTSLFGYLATSFFSPEPLVTCVLLTGIAATNILRVMRARRRTKARYLSKRASSSHTLTRDPFAPVAQARFLWYFHICLDPTQMFLPFHVGSIALAILLAYMQSHVMRRQFLMKIELQRIKDGPPHSTPNTLGAQMPSHPSPER